MSLKLQEARLTYMHAEGQTENCVCVCLSVCEAELGLCRCGVFRQEAGLYPASCVSPGSGDTR